MSLSTVRTLASADPAAPRAEIAATLSRVRAPFRVAEAFGVEEFIDPRATRALLCDWMPLAYEIEPTQLGPKRHGAGC